MIEGTGPLRIEKIMESPRGKLVIAACSSGAALAGAVLKYFKESFPFKDGSEGPLFLGAIDFHFADSETCVRLNADVSGCDVFLFQGLYDHASGGSVDRNLMALFAAVRALREWGARHVTVVAPYFAYARQDKPTRSMREPTTARLVADLMIEAGMDRIITVHPHVPVQAFFGKIPVNTIETVDLFAEEFSAFKGREDVIAVAPDGGAFKFVSHFSRTLDIKTAVTLKERSSGGSVSSELVGELKGKKVAIILDDMISSGETIHVLVRMLAEMSIPQIIVGATHNLCMESGSARLVDMHSRCNLTNIVVTDSIAQSPSFLSLPFLRVRTLAGILGKLIQRIHCECPVD